ncbi:MAG: hypothetical protein JRD94_08100 [Deltaproteobacteria bacterium]|nr:hypothetical protein [Deltaproteobacteria bacterium]
MNRSEQSGLEHPRAERQLHCEHSLPLLGEVAQRGLQVAAKERFLSQRDDDELRQDKARDIGRQCQQEVSRRLVPPVEAEGVKGKHDRPDSDGYAELSNRRRKRLSNRAAEVEESERAYGPIVVGRFQQPTEGYAVVCGIATREPDRRQ